MRKDVAIVGGQFVRAAFVGGAFWLLYKFYRARRASADYEANKEADRPFTTVMFFTKESENCKMHLITFTPCAKLNCAVRYLRQVITHMDRAENSLSLCVFFLTFTPLCDAAINAHKRGVCVRVITDSHMGESGLTQALEFYKCGVQLRIRQIDALMHHKFAIIDNNILMNGSMNWTCTAFFGNYENIVVTNNPLVVKPFAEQFEQLWIDFAAPVDFEELSVGFKHLGRNALNDKL